MALSLLACWGTLQGRSPVAMLMAASLASRPSSLPTIEVNLLSSRDCMPKIFGGTVYSTMQHCFRGCLAKRHKRHCIAEELL